MPYINVKTNVALSDGKKDIIKRRLFDNISIIPGKSDRYLMVAIEDGVDMAFHRDSESAMAMVEVKLYGGSTKDAYQKLTAAICMIWQDEEDSAGGYCYVTYDEVKKWSINRLRF